MPTILRPPDRLTAAQKTTATTLYLAGPFDDGGDGASWRDDVIDACADLDIVIIDPRDDRWADLEPAHRAGAAPTTGSATAPSTPTSSRCGSPTAATPPPHC